MKNRIRILLAAAIAACTTSALAVDHRYAAQSICAWQDSTGPGTHFGRIANFSTTGVGWISCGINYDTASTNYNLRIDYFDGNGNSGAGDSLNCTPSWCSTDGTSCTAAAVRHSCTVPGGCGYAEAFTGNGYLAWNGLTRAANAYSTLNCGLPSDVGTGKSNARVINIAY